MLWITGDTHGDFDRLPGFRDNKTGPKLGPDDKLIICGDFGGVRNGGKKENRILDELAALPYEILFVDGNHENFRLLSRFPGVIWRKGYIHEIRPNIKHLTRGWIFDIDGVKIFTMGGARSHDIEDGILDPMDPNFKDDYALLAGTQARFRVKNRTWWPEELPTEIQIEQARKFLKFANYNVDYIVTHCAPNSIIDLILPGVPDKQDKLTDFFEEIQQKVGFRRWYFGHYHKNQAFCGGLFQCLYEQIMPML